MPPHSFRASLSLTMSSSSAQDNPVPFPVLPIRIRRPTGRRCDFPTSSRFRPRPARSLPVVITPPFPSSLASTDLSSGAFFCSFLLVLLSLGSTFLQEVAHLVTLPPAFPAALSPPVRFLSSSSFLSFLTLFSAYLEKFLEHLVLRYEID